MPQPDRPKRILLLGATGTIGQAVLLRLDSEDYVTTCLVRLGSKASLPENVERIDADVTDRAGVDAVFSDHAFDAVISCMASRTGSAADAWAIDHHANSVVLAAAKEAGVRQFVLLSAICVQRPRLAFQHAKLAFEHELMDSGLTWSIIRPTAFFKSLSGQLARVKSGKPFLVFGDGKLTACKPISDVDLAQFIVSCLIEPDRQNQVLPIGGPGPAITPLDQVAMISELLGRDIAVKRIPIGMMKSIIGALSIAGLVSSKARDKAELARIGHYYASESMLVWDEVGQRYDADATPEFGSDTLKDFYAKVLADEKTVGLGEHSVF